MNNSRNIKSFLKNKSLYATLIILIFGIAWSLDYFDIIDFNRLYIFNHVGISDVTTRIYEEDMCVHFMNVGKADCIYINCQDKNILIDAADKEPADTVVEYLKRMNVSKLDLVVVSHPHRDHIGQMDKVIKEFKIDKFIEPSIPNDIIPTSFTYENMLKALIKNNVLLESPHAGDKFNLGNMEIFILGPIKSHKNLNNNSLVMKITYGEVSFLFMGDAEKSEESDIINSDCNLKSTVLKVGHHGSNTSSSYKFLNKVKPEYAVISVGEDRSALPKERVLEMLGKFCDKIYRTDENGTIIFLTDGKSIKVESEK